MSLSRRDFVRSIGLGGAGPLSGAWIAARGREALAAESWPRAVEAGMLAAQAANEIRISSNENPLGPGRHVVDAMIASFGDTGRYPTNARPNVGALREAVAEMYDLRSENVVIGNGSGELLGNAVRAFTSASRPLVTASPTFASPESMARAIGSPIKRVPLDGRQKLDLEKMLAEARGAGLVFFCNPNNPTATVHGAQAVRDFISQLARQSPDTYVLLDEAYHDYVTDPSHATGVPLVTQYPKVFVARTFSKAYGMAGLRVGYAVGDAETIRALDRWTMTFNVSSQSVAAAVAALANQRHIDQERRRNTEVRQFTSDFFRAAGYELTDSQTNFIFVNLGRPASEFRDACREHNVMVGRDFPPLEKSWSRISIGTMDEMRRATEVFRKVLDAAPTAASRG